MNEENSVMILGENLEFYNDLQNDLNKLGFKPIPEKFSDADTDNILQKHPDAILLDLTLKDWDSFSTGKFLLQDKHLAEETALVALVSENSINTLPLDYQFADIVRTPYDINELGYRIRRVIHLHHQEFPDDTIHIGDLSISPSRYEVKVYDQPIPMKFREYQLFKYLVTHSNRVLTRQELLANIWGHSIGDNSRTVDVHICRVREKIGDTNQKYIKTVRGVGYIFRFSGN